MALPFARTSRLERKKSMELLLAVAPFASHRPWPVVAVVGALLPAHLALGEAQERVFEKTLHVVHQVRWSGDVTPLPPLLPVLLWLLQLALQKGSLPLWPLWFPVVWLRRPVRLWLTWLGARVLLPPLLLLIYLLLVPV